MLLDSWTCRTPKRRHKLLPRSKLHILSQPLQQVHLKESFNVWENECSFAQTLKWVLNDGYRECPIYCEYSSTSTVTAWLVGVSDSDYFFSLSMIPVIFVCQNTVICFTRCQSCSKRFPACYSVILQVMHHKLSNCFADSSFKAPPISRNAARPVN